MNAGWVMIEKSPDSVTRRVSIGRLAERDVLALAHPLSLVVENEDFTRALLTGALLGILDLPGLPRTSTTSLWLSLHGVELVLAVGIVLGVVVGVKRQDFPGIHMKKAKQSAVDWLVLRLLVGIWLTSLFSSDLGRRRLCLIQFR